MVSVNAEVTAGLPRGEIDGNRTQRKSSHRDRTKGLEAETVRGLGRLKILERYFFLGESLEDNIKIKLSITVKLSSEFVVVPYFSELPSLFRSFLVFTALVVCLRFHCIFFYSL